MVSILALILLIMGLIFFTGGSVGILRFPDFYSRLHPAGKLDTMGLFMTLSGMALYVLTDFSLAALLTALKIMLIVVFIFITSPTATHSIADAGMRAGLPHWTNEHRENE
ncbi:MAG TPA: monovalent cation/H(+) antiporter subunit G [Desulfosalsimonadaceae bacterium]|nr:monovalent cation/H(+) antiporter subunit G [Desulfosalsimonadaceae bacterium]